MSSEESQKAAAAGANTGMLNRTSESQPAWADTSSEANLSINPPSFGQQGTSQPQNIPNTEENMVATAANQADKKKKSDRAYRQRIKERKIQLEDNCHKLRKENADLKSENENLKKSKDMMSERLEKDKDETEQLKSEICRLKRINSLQQFLVETLTQKLINDDHQLELTKLKNKIDVLLQNSTWDSWMTEKAELLERNQNLEHQIKAFKLQVEALCERGGQTSGT